LDTLDDCLQPSLPIHTRHQPLPLHLVQKQGA